MTGKMNWARARLHGRPTQDFRTEAEAIKRSDRRLRGHRRRPSAVQSPPPTMVYRARSICPDGSGAVVEIIELPQALRFRKVFGVLQARCPDHVPVERWRMAVTDGGRFLARWGLEAESLGWTAADLFGLAPVPDRPQPSFSRMSRLDQMGLIWLLQGRRVTEMSATAATIRNPRTGVVTVYRPLQALGPVGDSLLDPK